MKVRILQINFFKVTLRTIKAILPQVWDHITKTVFSKYFFLFSILNSRMSRNMGIWRHKLCNSKTGVGPTFTWSTEPWYKHMSGNSLSVKRPYLGHNFLLCNTMLLAPGPVWTAPDSFHFTNTSSRIWGRCLGDQIHPSQGR